MHLAGHLIAAGLLFAAAGTAYADLPAHESRTSSERVNADELSMSMDARNALQKRLEHAVFIVRVQQPKLHSLAYGGVRFDGACAAVSAEYIRDILKEEDQHPEVSAEAPSEPEKKNTGSFFGRGLDRVSSPFAAREKSEKQALSAWQYYLTTADWLTGGDSIEIVINGKPVRSELIYRDEAQNAAVLRTRHHPYVNPVEIVQTDEKNAIPALVFLLLSPGTQYSSLTQHMMTVSEMHRYGVTNQTARNGYPIFTPDERLVGLTVGPTPDHTQAYVVHPGLLDRALHPDKYSRIKKEIVDTVNYTDHGRGNPEDRK